MKSALSEFIDAHGDNAIPSSSGSSTFLLPDGASYYRTEFADGPLYQFREPPTETAQNLRARMKYISTKLRAEETAFVEFKNAVNWQARFHAQGTVPPPPADAKEQLEAGAKRITKLREQLAELDRELGQLPDEIARREYLERQRTQGERFRQHMAEINSVQIG